MSNDWDISIYNRHCQLVLAAEVKVGLNEPVEWAAEFRRNIFSHDLYAPMPYFMFILPDKIYMWTNPSTSEKITLPDYTEVMRGVLRDGLINCYPHSFFLSNKRSQFKGTQIIKQQWGTDTKTSFRARTPC